MTEKRSGPDAASEPGSSPGRAEHAELEAALERACRAGQYDQAATTAIRYYGGELLGFVTALLRNAAEADDVFAIACEQLWRGLPQFAWGSSFRTWAYAIARNACISYLRGPRKKQPLHVGTASLEQLVGEVKTRTQTLIRTETKDRFAAIRAALDPDDQTLLILRIDRKLAWRDIARILDPEATTPAQLERTSATLRKRLERLKTELRAQLK